MPLTGNGQDFASALVAAIPHLRAFARSFINSAEGADDLVQDTLIKAWQAQDSFAPNSNFRAWLFTILRNNYFSQHRKQKRMVEDPDQNYTRSLAVNPDQLVHMDFVDLGVALGRLPAEQREALMLVCAEHFSYEEAAAICGVAVGTIKSRVNRARARLSDMLDVCSPSEFGPDPALSSGTAKLQRV